MGEEEIKLKKIKDHKFMVLLVIDFGMTKFGGITKEGAINYVSKIYGKLSQIKRLLETLQMIRIMIAQMHPIVFTNNQSVISKPAQLRYHIENYFLRITTYKDLVHQLLILVLQLNIKKTNNLAQLIRKQVETSNDNIILQLVSDLETLFTEVKKIRNKLAHEATLSDVDIDIMETAYFLNKETPEIFDSEEFEIYSSMLILRNTQEMMKIEEDLATNLLVVADNLYDRYKNILERFN